MPFKKYQFKTVNRFLKLLSINLLICFIISLSFANLWAADVTVAFDPSTDTRVEGYNFYYGLSTKFDNKVNIYKKTSYTASNLTEGSTYYFAATSYDSYGKESAFSEVLSYKVSEKKYTIAASAGTGGSINPSGNVTVTHGTSQSFTMTPSEGQKIKGVLVDGNSVGAVTSYTFSNVTSNRTISVSFENIVNNTPDPVGSLTGSSRSPSGSVNLTSEGTSDWAHWGLYSSSSYNRKSTGAQRISNFTRLGDNEPDRFTDARVAYSWNNGTPKSYISGTTTGIYFSGYGNGYQLTVPADTSNKTFKIYLGGYNARGRFEATLSDGSAAPYVVNVENFYGVIDRVITLNYKATKPSSLIVKYTLAAGWSGNITLQAATLQEEMDSYAAGVLDNNDNSTPQFMEVGEVFLDHNWQRVEFESTFANPIVVAKPASLDDPDPAVVRIRNVDNTGFDIRIQEWDYLDGIHGSENVSYIVVEKGSYILPGDIMMEAATFEADRQNFRLNPFLGSFNQTPVVLASVTSVNRQNAVDGRIRNVSKSGFEYLLQEQGLNSQMEEGTETVSFIAIEPFSGVLNGLTIEVGTTGAKVNHAFYDLTFIEDFLTVPHFFADMQTANGLDTSNIRYRNKDFSKAEIHISEEQSKDTEIQHANENIGYMIIDY